MPHDQPHIDRDYQDESRRARLKERLKMRNLRQAVNRLLRKQIKCNEAGKACHNCEEKCIELQEWINKGED